jgi:hypothetical protein
MEIVALVKSLFTLPVGIGLGLNYPQSATRLHGTALDRHCLNKGKGRTGASARSIDLFVQQIADAAVDLRGPSHLTFPGQG